MDINEILSGVACECGKHHACSIEKVYIEKGATARLGELCEKYNNIIVVADENTYAAGGKKVEAVTKEFVYSGEKLFARHLNQNFLSNQKGFLRFILTGNKNRSGRATVTRCTVSATC